MRAITAPLIALCLMTAGAASAQHVAPNRWQVQATGPVTFSMEVGDEVGSAWARSGDGTWHRLQPTVEDGRVRIRLGPEQIRGGAALVVLDPPEWLEMDDARPPDVLRFTIDGFSHRDESGVDLGWIDAPPARLTLAVRDEKNPIDPDSIAVTVGGRTLRPDGGVVTWTPHDERSGTVRVHPRRLDGLSERRRATVELVVDDYAVDEVATRRSVRWALAPSTTLDDGTVVTIDSLTGDSGWQDWTVVVDGEVMTDSDPTTAGKTWLSDKRGGEHFIRFDFPEARAVSGVDLWWPFYQVWRTSRSYQVQTWDGHGWVTQVEVRDQAEKAHSEHRFEPVTTAGVRILQAPMGGQAAREDLMWLAEVEIACAE